jgi:mitogen-activated protein kinase 1/3
MLVKAFRHENLLSGKEIHIKEKENELFEVFFVTDFMDFDLGWIMSKARSHLTEEHVQYFMYQIFLGLHALHKNNIVHKNLCPENILINKECDIKITGFGRNYVAEKIEEGFNYFLAKTSSYKAPELIHEFTNISKAANIWSVGCIFFELLNKKTFYSGIKNYLQLLTKILELLGTPSEETLKLIKNENAKMWIKKQKYKPSQKPSTVLLTKDVDVQAMDLLDKCMVFDPRHRITVEEALQHPYFKDLFSQEDLDVPPIQLDFSFENDFNLTFVQLKQRLLQEAQSLLI